MKSCHVCSRRLHGVDCGLARILAARLDVEVHLPDLERPLDDRVEILLLHPALGLQAEIVGKLAHDVRTLVGRSRLEQLAKEPLAELAGLLEILLVDRRDHLGVVALELATGQKGLLDLVQVLA